MGEFGIGVSVRRPIGSQGEREAVYEYLVSPELRIGRAVNHARPAFLRHQHRERMRRIRWQTT
ncbi:MAG: hypothetical protein CME15_00520 [Gemmatimonadetes bacterium]|nr:hypothetical protein [Gemmatimonadota bacterium]